MKLTLDEKLECVLIHLNDNLPLHTISKEKGINVARLKYCVDLCKNGEKLLSRRKRKEEHTPVKQN